MVVLGSNKTHPSIPLLRVYLKSGLKHQRELEDENNIGSEWAPLYSLISLRTKQCECKSIQDPDDVFDFNLLSPAALNEKSK